MNSVIKDIYRVIFKYEFELRMINEYIYRQDSHDIWYIWVMVKKGGLMFYFYDAMEE